MTTDHRADAERTADVAAIRARLEAATPGPWELNRHPHGGGRAYVEAPRTLIADFYQEHDRELLFHAPADIAALLAEVERLSMTAGVLRSHLESLWKELFENAAVSHEARMKRALGVLRSALEGEQDFVNAFEQVREDRARAEAERDALAQRLARVEALRDSWLVEAARDECRCGGCDGCTARVMALDLRAALEAGEDRG